VGRVVQGRNSMNTIKTVWYFTRTRRIDLIYDRVTTNEDKEDI
jgi:hypothetical protein